MDLLTAAKISGTALAAHRTKINVIAENLANVDTTRTKEGGPYRRKMVVFIQRHYYSKLYMIVNRCSYKKKQKKENLILLNCAYAMNFLDIVMSIIS